MGDKLEAIYGQMTNLCKQFRYTHYRKDYWYVKGVEISYNEGTMTLTLSPLPSPYPDEKISKTTSTTSTGKTNTDKVNKKTNNFNAPSWLSKTDREWAVAFVTDAVRGSTDKLTMAKRIYDKFKNGYKYSSYSDLKYTTAKGNRKNAYLKGKGNCADGANILETLMLTAGINSRIKHAPNHYILKISINGKTYWCDNRSTKAWNTVWEGRTSNSEANITDGVYING